MPSIPSIQGTLHGLDRYVTADYLATLLELRPRTIYKWARTGHMPSIRVNDVVRFEGAAQADWLDSTTLLTTERPLRDTPKAVAI
jgi:hypothetical protein